MEKELWEVNDTKSDRVFMKRLSKWVIENFGNVNVAQRLSIIKEQIK